MSSLTLEVRCMAGTDIKTGISDALDLCNKLGLAYVKFNFNGTEVSVGESCVVSSAIAEWKRCGGIKQKYYVFN